MSDITASLVVSSSVPFDHGRVSEIIGLTPTKIWKRKEGLKVHGPDTIPSMSWILECVGEQERSFEETLDTLLDQVAVGSERLVKLANELGLTISIVCRLVTRDSEQGIELSPKALARLGSLNCRAILSVEYEPENPDRDKANI